MHPRTVQRLGGAAAPYRYTGNGGREAVEHGVLTAFAAGDVSA
jgi:hypothetical protein